MYVDSLTAAASASGAFYVHDLITDAGQRVRSRAAHHLAPLHVSGRAAG
jgi:hypothetical protein